MWVLTIITDNKNISNIRKILVILAAVFALFTASAAPAYAKDEKDMSIYGIFLGDSIDGGDATLIESDGSYLLMDLGSCSNYTYTRDFLRSKGITHLSLYISHVHEDHTCFDMVGNSNFTTFLQDFEVDRLYLPDKSLVPELDQVYAGRYEHLETNYRTVEGKEPVYVKVGDSWNFGDVKVEIIGPVGLEDLHESDFDRRDTPDQIADGYLNNCSLIARLTCGNTRFLTTGDAQEYQEKALVSAYGDDLRFDIYKLGHHGTSNANKAFFLEKVQPRFSFAGDSGKAWYNTDENGLKTIKNYKALSRVMPYGIVYLVGFEKNTVCYKVVNDSIELYTSEDRFNEPLTGLIRFKGNSAAVPAWHEETDMDPYFSRYYYLQPDGTFFTGTRIINGKLLFFDENGLMQHGSYGVNKSGQVVYKGNDLYTIGGVKMMRAFDEATGECLTGWYTSESTGVKYYFDSTGAPVRGTQKIDGKVYLFQGKYGGLSTNKWITNSEGTQYYGADGSLTKGWAAVDGKICCFSSTGKLTILQSGSSGILTFNFSQYILKSPITKA